MLAGARVLAGTAWAVSLAPTPEQTLGPFYPSLLPEDREADFIVINRTDVRAPGTALRLTVA